MRGERGKDSLPRAFCTDLSAEVAFKLETEGGAEACGDQVMSNLVEGQLVHRPEDRACSV